MNAIKIQYFKQLNPKIIPKRRIEKKQNLIYDHQKYDHQKYDHQKYDHQKIVTYSGPEPRTHNLERMNEDN